MQPFLDPLGDLVEGFTGNTPVDSIVVELDAPLELDIQLSLLPADEDPVSDISHSTMTDYATGPLEYQYDTPPRVDSSAKCYDHRHGETCLHSS